MPVTSRSLFRDLSRLLPDLPLKYLLVGKEACSPVKTMKEVSITPGMMKLNVFFVFSFCFGGVSSVGSGSA